jgi:hypothetical protein
VSVYAVSARKRLELHRTLWPEQCTATDAAIAAAVELCVELSGWTAGHQADHEARGTVAERVYGPPRGGILAAYIDAHGEVEVLIDLPGLVDATAVGAAAEAVAFIRGMEAP